MATDTNAPLDRIGNLEITKIRNRDLYLVLDGDDEEVGRIRKASGDEEWSVEVHDQKFKTINPPHTFKSAASAATFVLGHVHGLSFLPKD